MGMVGMSRSLLFPFPSGRCPAGADEGAPHARYPTSRKCQFPPNLEGRGAFISLVIAVLLGIGLNPVHAAIPATDAGSDAGADVASVEDVTTAATAFNEVEFSADMLQFPVDVSLFAEGNALPAGHYRVDLYTNSEWKGRVGVRFAMVPGNDRVAQPCFDLALLDTLGFDLSHLSDSDRTGLQRGDSVCRPLGELIEGASAQYSSGDLKLNISAPQIVLRREARGYVDPALWDNGVTAGLLDYSYNGYRSQNGFSGSNTSHYLGLRAGFNLGAWRLRYNATASKNDATGFHYRGNSAWLERGLPGLNSRLTIGDTVTDGQVFDSVRFRGVRMDSDERMRPDSQRGFAPVVRGIAQSNAMVSISQLGQEIYQTNVPPGPFVIDDLYPSGGSGDLLVTITEADGSQHTFTIAYAGAAKLVRPGTTHYTLAAGQYENPSLTSEPVFVMGNVRHGLSNSLTGYAGLMVAESYSALSGGMAFNLRIGALTTDFTFANTRTQSGNYRGSSVRASWAKILPVLGTNVMLASYRYSSEGYYDPAAAFMLRDQVARGLGGSAGIGMPGIPGLPGIALGTLSVVKPKNRLILNASQNLPGAWGYLNISASSQDYWTSDGRDTQYQLGWNRQLARASLGLSASRTHNVFWNRWDNQYMLNLSMPLGGGMYGNGSYSHREDGPSFNASVSGTAGKYRQFGFGAFVNADDRSERTQYGGGLNGAWNTSHVQMSANLSTSRGGNRQYGVSLNGGVVAFGGGIILTPKLGDTIAIAQAKDAAGARLSGQSGNVRLNRRGLVVVPYLQAYRQNRVNLDPSGLSTDIALSNTTRQVAPTAGAVALLQYETERGYSILLNGRHSDGRYLPFAAAVFDESGRNVGHIAQGGQALLRVNATQGVLTVRWGSEADQVCQLNYAVAGETRRGRRKSAENTTAHDFRHVEAVCASGMTLTGE